MNTKGIAWLGIRTAEFDAMLHMFEEVMGMELTEKEPGFAVMKLPNEDLVELFGEDSPYNRDFTNPVAGFLVDDIASARQEMESQGIEFLGPIQRTEEGYAWSHFRGPDGIIYEITYSPEHPALGDD